VACEVSKCEYRDSRLGRLSSAGLHYGAEADFVRRAACDFCPKEADYVPDAWRLWLPAPVAAMAPVAAGACGCHGACGL